MLYRERTEFDKKIVQALKLFLIAKQRLSYYYKKYKSSKD